MKYSMTHPKDLSDFYHAFNSTNIQYFQSLKKFLLLTRNIKGEILEFGVGRGRSLIVICHIIHQYKFPFGVINKLSTGGISIDEKPTISKMANAGIYVINKSAFSQIEYGYRDMTELISSITPVNIFTLFEKWTDIGVLSSYQSVQSKKIK